jgi:hypothetical protein
MSAINPTLKAKNSCQAMAGLPASPVCQPVRSGTSIQHANTANGFVVPADWLRDRRDPSGPCPMGLAAQHYPEMLIRAAIFTLAVRSGAALRSALSRIGECRVYPLPESWIVEDEKGGLSLRRRAL